MIFVFSKLSFINASLLKLINLILINNHSIWQLNTWLIFKETRGKRKLYNTKQRANYKYISMKDKIKHTTNIKGELYKSHREDPDLCGWTFEIVGVGAVHVGGLRLSLGDEGDGMGGDALEEVFVMLVGYEDTGTGIL